MNSIGGHDVLTVRYLRKRVFVFTTRVGSEYLPVKEQMLI
jgi:hypothetical protein